MSTEVKVKTEPLTINNKIKKRRSRRKRSRSFIPHMTLNEAKKLKVDDDIDHRDEYGFFLQAKILEKDGTNLRLRYYDNDDNDDMMDDMNIWSDYNKELYRFASYSSITRRPSHRLKNMEKGNSIKVNPLRKKKNSGWKIGKINKMDKKSGQIQVAYKAKNGIRYLYWTHLDNIKEIKSIKDNDDDDGDNDNDQKDKRERSESVELNKLFDDIDKLQKTVLNDNDDDEQKDKSPEPVMDLTCIDLTEQSSQDSPIKDRQKANINNHGRNFTRVITKRESIK